MVKSGFIGKCLDSLSENSPAIFTGAGVAGVFITAFMVYKASPKIHYILEGYKAAQDLAETQEERHENTKQMVKEMAPVILPPVGMAVVTSAAIIGANHINSKRLAVMSAAYAMSSDKLKTLKEKTEEYIDPKKVKKMKEEMAQDKVKANPPIDNDIIYTGDGDVLCLDDYSGRYFKSNPDKIDKAIYKLSAEVVTDMWVSLNDFYELIGLGEVPMGDDFGWNVDDLDHGLIPLEKDGALTNDGKLVLSISYDPRPHYNKWSTYA